MMEKRDGFRWKRTVFGVVLGAFFVMDDHLAQWTATSDLHMGQVAGRIFGVAVVGGIIGFVCDLVLLWRERASELSRGSAEPDLG
jgi:hypothetical protein